MFTDRGLLAVVGSVGVVVLLLLFDRDIGIILSILLLLGALMTFRDKRVSLPLEGRRDFVKSIGLALVGIFGMLASSSAFLYIIGATSKINLFAVVQTFSQGAVPPFSGNPFFLFLAFALGFAIIESYWLGSLFEAFVDGVSGTSFNLMVNGKPNTKLLGIIVLLGILFAGLHIGAKIGLGSAGFTNAIWIVFWFAVWQMILMSIEKQKMAAILMHIGLNSLAIASVLNLGYSPILVVGIVIGGIVFLYSRLKQAHIISL